MGEWSYIHLFMIHLLLTVNISSRFSSNSEAKSFGLLEIILNKYYLNTTCSVIPISGVLPIVKGLNN